MNKKNKYKNWYTLNNVFIHIVRLRDKTITLWSNKKQGGIKYQLLIWKDENGVCFKFGKIYGLGSCWETILPKKKTCLILRKQPYNNE